MYGKSWLNMPSNHLSKALESVPWVSESSIRGAQSRSSMIGPEAWLGNMSVEALFGRLGWTAWKFELIKQKAQQKAGGFE